MAREPSYPKDAPVGETEGEPTHNRDQDAADPRDRSERKESGRAKQLMTGAAIGIGSAALVAALLYANRSRKNDKGPSR